MNALTPRTGSSRGWRVSAATAIVAVAMLALAGPGCENRTPPPSRAGNGQADANGAPAGPGEGSRAPEGGGYVGAVLRGLSAAEIGVAKVNLAQLHKALAAHASLHDGRYPDDLQQLVRFGRVSEQLLKAPGGQYDLQYIGDQTTAADGSNVLVYDPRPIYNDKALVLYLDGTAKTIDAETLKQQVQATRRKLQ